MMEPEPKQEMLVQELATMERGPIGHTAVQP